MKMHATPFPKGYGTKYIRPHRATGEQNANVKINWSIARKIRADAKEGHKLQHIAWWHNVNPGTVHKIINNKQWIE